MDFLDPKKERQNQIKLLLGYCLVALAIGIATLVLLYQSYGYNLNHRGQITQNGLLFVSSQPSGASISLNGKLYPSSTDTRVIVPAAAYRLQISDPGYRDWVRSVYVAGGDVQHFDYPFLFPTKLQTSSLASLSAEPSIATQSLDRRWLLLGHPDASGTFTLYDMKNSDKPVATEVTLPTGSFTPGDGAQTWSLEEWANDNRHVLLVHTYTAHGTAGHEYVLLDRDTPSDSVNLTNSLNLSQSGALSMFDNQASELYVYNSDEQSLRLVNVSNGLVISKLMHVLAYKTYSDNKILYVTDQPPSGKLAAGQVSVVLQDGQKTYTLRTLPAGAPAYELNLAQYAGDWYVAVAASNDSSVYVYKNPQSQATAGADTYPATWRRLSLSGTSYLAFSGNTQFLLAESGQNFYVYDLENVAQYRYTASQPLDQPQVHATWMDGDRLMYVSGGKLVVFDYDYRNQQTLVPADANYLPFFASDYSYLYTLRPASPDGTTKPVLTSTPLVIKP